MNISRTWSAYEQTQLKRYALVSVGNKNLPEIPVEYLTGKVEFADLVLTVNPRVLIPRVESEELVHLIVGWLKTRPKIIKIVDVGTGSGAIGLGVAHKLKNSQIARNLILTDISPEALVVAARNLEENQDNFSKNWQIFTKLSNLLIEVDQTDMIIANLPYIPRSRLLQLPPSVKDYEPLLALDGGELGLDLIQKLLNQAQTKLSPLGCIWLEIDETHTPEQFQHFGLPFIYSFINDQFNKPRFVRVDWQDRV